MAKRKAKASDGTEASAGEAHAPAEATSTAPEQLASKMEGVRKALRELGKKATPSEIQDFLRKRYDLDMNAKVISVYKSKIVKTGGRRGKRGRKASVEAGAGPLPGAVTATPPGRSTGPSISYKDLHSLKDIRDRLGAGRLKEIVELMQE